MNRNYFVKTLLLMVCCAGVGLAQVRINEVESNGGIPGDWVELINAGSAPVDVSGWKMLDNDNTHTPYVIPAGTSIPAGGYFLLEEAQFGFGLGAPDSVRIWDAATPVTGTPTLEYAWTAHALPTYGRCPNGTGNLVTTGSSTKGAANDCASASPVKINEIESNNGVPGDWVELYNTGTSAANVGGFTFKDNDDTHAYVIPAGTSIAAGGYLVLEEAQFGFGLGSGDSARLYDGANTVVDSYAWTAHAAVTYGRCPSGTGPFAENTSSTKGAANECGVSVKINEIESSGGTPGDWVELYNPGTTAATLTGLVIRDDDDSHAYTIPGGTTIAPGGYLVIEETQLGFGLGQPDAVRLFSGTTLVDSYTWTTHATTTYGRCLNGSGDFTTTTAPTKGAINACPGVVNFSAWPGGSTVTTPTAAGLFGSNASGLIYEPSGTSAPGVLWLVRNGPGSIFRMVFNGTTWTPDTTNSWGSGKLLQFLGGVGSPDSEGITFAGSSAKGLYVSVERDNNNNSVSRNMILRFDANASGSTLVATHEWSIGPDLPVTGPNLGAEAVVYIPDTYLVANGFFDESKNHTYDPSEHPNHGAGLFFVGLEATGNIYGYALDHSGNGAFTRVATIVTGFPGVMDLQLDMESGDFWAVCDDTCQGRSVVLRVGSAGKFVVVSGFERPTGMPNLNNEGFAIAPLAECVSNLRPAFWSDDSETSGFSIRQGTLSCSPVVTISDTRAPIATPVATPSANASGWNNVDVTVNWKWADNTGGSGINNASCTTSSVSSGEGTLTLTASCKDVTGNTGNGTYSVKVDKVAPVVEITSPVSSPAYPNYWQLGFDWSASDVLSGLGKVSAALDGTNVSKGQTVDLMYETLGQHKLTVNATDIAGNTVSSTVTFTVEATVESLSVTIDRLQAMGDISPKGIANSLKAKLGKKANLNAFFNELDAQRGKHVTERAYQILKAGGMYVVNDPQQ